MANNCKEVLQMEGQVFLRAFPSITEAAKSCGANNSEISLCTVFKRKRAGGFNWTFREKMKEYLSQLGEKEMMKITELEPFEPYKVEEVIYSVRTHGFIYAYYDNEWVKSEMPMERLLRLVNRELNNEQDY